MDKIVTGTRFFSILFFALFSSGCAVGPIITSTSSAPLPQPTTVNMLEQQKIAGKSTIDKVVKEETSEIPAESSTAPAANIAAEESEEAAGDALSPATEVATELAAPIIDTNLGIAEEHLPAPGHCRIWYPAKSIESQPAARKNCERIQKRMPAGAILLYRPLVNSEYVEVCHFDEKKRAVVKMVRFYLAATGELKREERF